LIVFIICPDAGAVDPAYILEQIELQIAKLKEEAFSRKEILEKVEKWLAACDEESWLEEYNRVLCFYHLFIFDISFFVPKSICLIVTFWLFRMRTDTMPEEVLILLLSVLRKLVLWLINFQVYTASRGLAFGIRQS
jgi:hypothetical protein